MSEDRLEIWELEAASKYLEIYIANSRAAMVNLFRWEDREALKQIIIITCGMKAQVDNALKRDKRWIDKVVNEEAKAIPDTIEGL